MEDDIVMSSGDVITCPNGHGCFEVLKDQRNGGRILAKDYRPLNGIEAGGVGERVGRCPVCKKKVVFAKCFVQKG